MDFPCSFAQRILDFKPIAGGTKTEGPWLYNVVCHKDGIMEDPATPRPQGRWRCRDCYLRSPPVWSAYNDEVSLL